MAMFTVLRLEFAEGRREDMLSVAGALNELIPGTCTGPDRIPLRMSCTISNTGPWGKHLEEIGARLNLIMPTIHRYSGSLKDKQIDILIEPDDWEGSAFDEYPLEPRFLQVIVGNDIDLVFTISRP